MRRAVAGVLLTAATASAQTPAPSPSPAARPGRLAERARQDRSIVYVLQPPETHAFRLYHDFTETRPGTERYLNVVRRGSTVSDPSARNLDTGEALPVETLKGAAIREAGIDIGEAVRPDSEVVVVRYPAVKPGGSLRLRITETYTDPGRYGLDGEEPSTAASAAPGTRWCSRPAGSSPHRPCRPPSRRRRTAASAWTS